MSTTFGKLKARLTGVVDILPPSLMEDFINSALEDIYNSNSWGFLMKEDFMRTPALIDQGTVSVTKFSNIVTLDSVASAKVAAIAVEDVPLIGRQFRVSSSTITGKSFSYNIIDFDASNINAIKLTIDPIYLDATNLTAKFQIVKLYYAPPQTTYNNEVIVDFRFWKYFINLKLQRRLILDTSLEILNSSDPSRFACDEPRHVVAHPANNDDEFPTFELYPAPKFERVYRVIYQREGLALYDDEQKIPKVLSMELVLERAKYRLYEYALANTHKYPELKGSAGRFQNLMAATMNMNNRMSYPSLLEDAKLEDENNYPKAYLGDYMRMPLMDSYIGNFGYYGEFSNGNYSNPGLTVIVDA